MPLTIYFAAGPQLWSRYHAPLTRALQTAGIAADLSDAAPRPEEVDYIVYSPGSGIDDFSPFTRCKAVLNLWAGVEKLVGNPTLTQPLCRMVDPALTEGMVEYVTGHVLRHHLGIDAHVRRQDGEWRHVSPPLARDRRVTILGLGELGQACAHALAALNFRVAGWSRTPKSVPGIACHSGEPRLAEALRGAEIVVLLLPQTEATRDILNAERIGLMAAGGAVINPGRGPLIDDAALLAALDAGQLAHATLDVFRTEPLPPEHPFWAHPQVTVTPHIAADTRPDTASEAVVENIRRGEAGLPFLNLVDRRLGY